MNYKGSYNHYLTDTSQGETTEIQSEWIELFNEDGDEVGMTKIFIELEEVDRYKDVELYRLVDFDPRLTETELEFSLENYTFLNSIKIKA